MHVFVGLGNPGIKYARSRHNLGRLILEMIAQKQGVSLIESGRHVAHIGTCSFGTEQATILLPNTFMNKSGSSVKAVRAEGAEPSSYVVVYDDIDLPWGTVRIAFARGSGGHNGVESVIKALGTKEFARVRIGIAPTTPSGVIRKPRGEGAVVKFVMHDIGSKESEELPDIADRVAHALELILTKGREHAMNETNRELPQKAEV